MRIACVSFYWGENEIGGAQVPAIALADWFKRLGLEADAVGFTGTGKPGKRFVKPSIPITLYKNKEYAEALNSYDFIIFVTYGMRKDFNNNHSKYFDPIKTPFMGIIHGEGDPKLYLDYEIIDLHPYNKGYIITSDDSFEHFKYLKKPKYKIYPLTLPDYLLKSEDKWIDNPTGLVYAARLTSLKWINLLAEYSKSQTFRDTVGPIDVYGTAPIWHIEDKINKEIQPQWNRYDKFYSVYDIAANKEKLGKYKFYWEVFGNRRWKFYLRRLNLSAAEAISCGCVLIANPLSVPYSLLSTIRSVNIDGSDSTPDRLCKDLDLYYESRRERMRDALLASEYSYRGVEAQVKDFISKL